MAHRLSTKELRNMSTADLHRETRGLRAILRKARLGIELNKEKDTAKYRRGRRELARMMTILTEMERNAPKAEKKAGKTKEALRKPKATTKVSARKRAKR
jgi:ribosomal protein L29